MIPGRPDAQPTRTRTHRAPARSENAAHVDDHLNDHIDFGEYLMVKNINPKDEAKKTEAVLQKTSTLKQIKSNLMIL